MHPYTLLASLAILWALTHFWWLPLVKDRWNAADQRAKMARAGLLVVVEKLRDLAAVGTIAVAVVVALVGAANVLGGAGVLWPKAAIEAMAAAYATAREVSVSYGSALGIVGLAGAVVVLWWAGRAAKRRVVAVWSQKADAEFSAMRSEPGRIDAARANPELLPFVQRLDATFAEITAEEQAASPDLARLARAQQAFGDALSQLAIESARLQVDFPAAAGAPPVEEARVPASGWRRALRVLASKRLAEDLGLVRKPLGWVANGLLFLSLVGWAAEPLADSLQLAVNNLRVQVVEREAQRDLEQALSRAEPAPTAAEAPDTRATDAVPAATRMLSRAIVRELARAPLLDHSARVYRTPRAEAEFIRAALAEQHLPATDIADDAARLRAEAAKAVAEAHAPAPPSAAARHVEELVRPTVERLHAEQPGRLAALVERLEARYTTPMSPLDAQGKLTSKLLDTVFDGTLDAKPEGELGKQAHKLGKDFGKNAVKTWADASVKRLIADAISGAARPSVYVAFESSNATRELIAALQAREGTGWNASPAAAREQRMAARVAEKVVESHADAHPVERRALAERLGGYERLFPADDGPPPSPSPSLPSNGPDRPRPPTHAAAEPSARDVRARATSVQAASRSFRVRGVIVGQELEGKTLDVTGIRWQLVAPARAGAATRVAVELRIADAPDRAATWRSAGSYDAGVFNQALRYAADRRVIATTITGGDGRQIGQLTYLHPALVDTPLGCRVVEADRLIDTFTSPRAPLAPAVAELAREREQMWSWLATMRLAEAVAASPSCPLEQVQRAVEQRRLQPVRFSAPMQEALDRLLTGHASAAPGSDRLLRRAAACSGGPSEALGACLCRQLQPDGLPERYWFPEDHTSQVRERQTALSADLAWLRPSADGLAHLDFWTHTTFALRDAASGSPDESQTAALDFPPTQLEALRKTVAERLPPYAAREMRSPTGDDFTRPLEEFVIAQRLARTALDGKLGRDFPVQQLLDLQRQTRRFVPTQPTIRWEAALSPGALRELLAGADAGAAERHMAYERDRDARERGARPVCDRASL